MEYTILDSVVMRSPVGHMGGLKKKLTLDMMLNDKFFMEALAFSNQEVYKSMQRGLSQQLINTITKYYLRYKYRSTPYGFFAGISNCKFGENTEIVKSNNEKAIKVIKVDFEWLYKVLKVLESSLDILENVQVKNSPNHYSLGNRLINPCFSNYGEIETSTNTQKDICRIKYSKQVQNVEVLAGEWIDYKKLINELSIINENVPETVLRDFVGKLIANSFLITSLRVPLTSEDPLEELLKVTQQFDVNENSKKFLQELKEINKLRMEYAEMQLGQGIETLLNLLEKMEEICPNKNYLGAIMGIPLEKSTISIEIKKELENLGRLISAFQLGDNEGHHIYQFKNKFVEKYGTNIEVPLLEVMDETMGLGDPYTKRLTQEAKLSAKTEKLKKVISDKICLCLKQGKSKIDLNEKDIEYFKNYKDQKNEELDIVNTFDLGIEIYAKTENDIDKGDFTISFSSGLGAPIGGQLINRFYNLFNKFTKEQLKKMYACAMDTEDYLIVDTSCFHPKARANNICTGNKNYQYSLDIQLKSIAENIINLRDILLGYDSKKDRLYLKSKYYNRKIKILGDYMLNQDTLSHTIRVLWEISSAYEKNSLESLVIILESACKYTPQICFGKVVLSNEQWKVEADDFENIKSFSKFCEDFKKFAREWNVPRYIVLVIRDHTLFVDLENEEYFRILHKEIEKQIEMEGKVKIERAKQVDNLWQKDVQGNCYSAEYIVQFLKKNEKVNNEISFVQRKKINRSVQSFYSTSRVFQPGEQGWFYFNIYLEEKKANEFLQIFLFDFIKKLTAECEIEKFFFIRYSDPEFHIRFRIKFKTMQIERLFLEKRFLAWFKRVQEEGYSYKYSLTPYEREIERYGGMELLEVAEKIFEFESVLVLELLSNLKKEQEKEEAVVFILVDTLMCLFEGEMKKVEEYLDDFVEQKQFRKEFSEVRKRLIIYFEGDEVSKQLMWMDGFHLRKETIKNYATMLKDHEEKESLTNYRADIIMSLLHMFCNRMNGDRHWERKMLSFARHIVHDLNSKQQYLKSSK